MKSGSSAGTFRRLRGEAGCFIISNPWDAGSARLLEMLGFKALTTTSAGLAFSQAVREMAENGTFSVGDAAMPHAEINNLFLDPR